MYTQGEDLVEDSFLVGWTTKIKKLLGALATEF